MKCKILIAATLSAAMLYSCKKENTVTPPPDNGNGQGTVNAKVKTLTNNSGVQTYNYDANGRLFERLSSSESKITYEYLPGKVIFRQFTTAGVNDFTMEYELDANGLAVKATKPTDGTYQSNSVFNNDKQLVKQIINYAGTIEVHDYFFSNGNCDSIRYSFNGNWNYTKHMTFYTDKPNYHNLPAYGIFFNGKGNKNLIKTEQFKYASGNTDPLITHEFEYDAKGRPVKETTTSGANINITYYTYY